MMRSFALIEGDRATMLHVRHDGDVTVFDRDRESAIRFRVLMDVEDDTTWRLLHRVLTGLVQAEARLIRIDRLVERVKPGWRPVPGEIDPQIPQRTLRRAHFAIDAIRYPDDEDFYGPPTGLLGIGEHGHVEPTGQILWIDAHRKWGGVRRRFLVDTLGGAMIKVSVTQDGELLDEIEFDGSNLVARAGALTVIHCQVMEECADEGLWHRVAHAARIVAERGDLFDILEADEPHRAATDANAALSATSPEVLADPDDAIRGGVPGSAVADDDLYHLERGPGERDEEYQERCRMLGCDESGHIRLARRRAMTECRVGCIICGRALENWSGGDNQPVGGLAFQCSGHWPSAVFDAEPGWLEINICELCLQSAVGHRLVLHGDRVPRHSPATYRLWQWPKRR